MLTLPNFLTMLRIIAVPVFLICVTSQAYRAAYLIFIGAGITDTVDGALARLTDSRSTLGAVLDPLADKLLLVSSFIVLGINGAVPTWLVALLVSRDVIIVGGYFVIYFVHQAAMPIEPTQLGKVNTFFELFTIAFVLMSLARPSLPLAEVNAINVYVTAVTAAVSGLQYVYGGLLWHQRRGASIGQAD